MVSRVVTLSLRALEFFWTLLILALVGNMIHDAHHGNPSIVNYDIFAAVLSMLSLFYLIPATIKDDFVVHPLIMIVLDVLNTLFFLCGALAMAGYLGVHSCDNQKYVLSNLVTKGSANPSKRCREAQATTAFLWFGFAAYAASAVISVLQSRGNVNTRGGGSRRRPVMTQV